MPSGKATLKMSSFFAHRTLVPFKGSHLHLGHLADAFIQNDEYIGQKRIYIAVSINIFTVPST